MKKLIYVSCFFSFLTLNSCEKETLLQPQEDNLFNHQNTENNSIELQNILERAPGPTKTLVCDLPAFRFGGGDYSCPSPKSDCQCVSRVSAFHTLPDNEEKLIKAIERRKVKDFFQDPKNNGFFADVEMMRELHQKLKSGELDMFYVNNSARNGFIYIVCEPYSSPSDFDLSTKVFALEIID